MKEMIKAEDVTRNMQKMRKSKGMTTVDVGQKLGKTYQAVSRQERHPLRLSLKTFMKYAEIYECKVSDFFAE